jgi:hypothetical protein
MNGHVITGIQARLTNSPKHAVQLKTQGPPSINSPSHFHATLKTDHTQCRDFPIKLIKLSSQLFNLVSLHQTLSSRVWNQFLQTQHEFLRRWLLLTPLHHLPNHQIQTYYIPTRTILNNLILFPQRRLVFLLQTTTPRWLYRLSHPQTQALDTRALGVCATTPFQGFYGCGGAVGECGGCVA